MKYLALALALSLFLTGMALAGVPDDLQQVSVTIKAGDAQGSGTIVTRKIGDDTVSFIWTAGHVVDNLRVVRQIITADGGTRSLVEFRDAQIVQEFQQNGRRVGETKLLRKYHPRSRAFAHSETGMNRYIHGFALINALP